jgi:hypothetical protein
MEAPDDVFEAAPLDRLARVVTASMWALACAFLVAGAVVVSGSAAGLILVVTGLALAATSVWMRRLTPRAYVIGDRAFTIRRRSSEKRWPGVATRARRGSLRLRLAGDGGVYGYLGRYRADGATVNAYVTDRARVVLIDVGGRTLAVSPQYPDRLVAGVEHGA